MAYVPDTLLNKDNNTSDDNSNNKVQIDFLIQIASSKKPISPNSRNFKGLKNVEEFKTSDRYKYAVGRKNSYNEVVNYSKVVKHYYPDAFVIAVKDGKIIPVKEALKEIKD